MRRLGESGDTGECSVCQFAVLHAVPFENRSILNGLVDVDDFPFPVTVDLDPEKVLEFTEILHVVLFV
jgi:hypothetical protein